MKLKVVFSLVLIVFVLAACGEEKKEDTKKSITVFAASSLTDSFGELKSAYEAQNKNVEVVLNLGPSSGLATQIIEGADADVFASANLDQLEKVKAEGKLQGDPSLLAENRLVIVAYKDSPIQQAEDIANEGIKLILVAPETPIRTYTDPLLVSLNDEFGEDFQTRVMQNVVSEEENVRQAVAKVALGEADASIVYLTDATPDILDEVRVIEFPEAYQVKAQSYIGTVSDDDTARAFVDFVLSSEGQAIMQKWGFTPVNP